MIGKKSETSEPRPMLRQAAPGRGGEKPLSSVCLLTIRNFPPGSGHAHPAFLIPHFRVCIHAHRLGR